MTTNQISPIRLTKPLRSWIDENTGRRIEQVTHYPKGGGVDYFRWPRHLPDGRVVICRYEPTGKMITLLDPDTGDLEETHLPGAYLRLRPTDGRMWYIDAATRELMEVDLPHGQPRSLMRIPPNIPGKVASITCDGKILIFEEYRSNPGHTIPVLHNVDAMWAYLLRPRNGAVYAMDVPSGRIGRLVEMEHVSPAHSDASPTDPTLLRYTRDTLESIGQRMFVVRTDGSEHRPLRVQAYGEMITHEFWWPGSLGANLVGYTYMDRRNDETLYTQPWCEYAERPTQLGICDLSGNEVFLSDPLNSYHAHLYVSRDGSMVSGEGTAYHCFVCAAPFDIRNTRVEFRDLATIHTPWIPTRGQQVHADFSADGKWLLYNDTIEGVLQVCRVRLDL